MPSQAFETIGFVTSAGGAQNEDRASHRGNIAWIVDGATDVLEDRLLPAASDAEWYAEQLHRELVRRGDDGVAGLERLLDEVTRDLAGRFAAAAKRPPAEVHEYPSAAGVIVRRVAGAIEVLSLGDCELITAASATDAATLGIDDRLRVRDRGTALAMRAVRDEGAQTWKEARKLLWPRFRTARANLNQPGGYPVFSIIPPPAGMVSVKTMTLPAGTPLLLASDGFMRLVEIFERYDRASLMEAVLRRGVNALHDELRGLEAADPECLRHPRTKPSDDATALLLTVT